MRKCLNNGIRHLTSVIYSSRGYLIRIYLSPNLFVTRLNPK